MKHIVKHVPHYLPLVGVLTAAVLGFFIFSYDKPFQFAVVFAASFSYVVWGIVHHHFHHDLYWEVVAEYMAIAMLGVIIAYSLLMV